MTSTFVYPLSMSLLIALMGLVSLCLQRKQLIVALINLEVMSLGLFVSLILTSVYGGYDTYMSLFLITLSVCEATLGLSLLTSVIRFHGKDYLSSMNMLKC
uniref:NADH-ubiquinone oxidoreductase chain 4L n=1 Tax=Pectinatella magnifica TaxID=350071 RepID=A0A344AUX2_9BILA|nr:NADH dehydrogenase subunit 4L [Pectinatella magnifica]AWX65969.1 NADH dehydrogenase subunit 4L [Pectinatella magnifica]